MVADESIQARQAALLLHALSRSARQQVLARLDVTQSARLKPLLDELDEIGLPQSLGQQISALAMPSARTSAVPEQMEALKADDVARCLVECAPATAAHLLRAGNWSWKTHALELMPGSFRTAVLDCMRREPNPLAPAVLQALCECLCQHATQERARHASADRASRALGARFRRLVGWNP